VTAAWLRAQAVLRRQWRATVFLAVFAGLAGGAVMSAWSYSRRAQWRAGRDHLGRVLRTE
jgi:hypothetical protein